MKRYILLVLIVFCVVLGLNSDNGIVYPDNSGVNFFDNSLTSIFDDYSIFQGSDEIETNISIPDELCGITPLDVCFVKNYNRFYICGEKGVIVYDAVTLNRIDYIEISDRCAAINGIHSYSQNRRICYIENADLIACYSNDFQVAIIDPSSNEIIESFNIPVTLGYLNELCFAISYNPRDGNLYSFFSNYDGVSNSNISCYIFEFNASGYTGNSYDYTFNDPNYHQLFVDVVFDPYQDVLYVAFSNFSNDNGAIYVMNIANLSNLTVNHIVDMGDKCGPICFIDNGMRPYVVGTIYSNSTNSYVKLILTSNPSIVSTTTIPNQRGNQCTMTKYIDDLERVYCGYKTDSDTGLFSLDNLGQYIDSYSLGASTADLRDAAYFESTSNLIVSHFDGIYVFNTQNNQLVNNYHYDYWHTYLAQSNILNKVMVLGQTIDKVNVLDADGNELFPEGEQLIGSEHTNGIYCDSKDKAYFWSSFYFSDTFFSIDTSSNSVETIFEYNPYDLVYNNDNEMVYCALADENIILEIDPDNDVITNSIYFSGNPKCNHLYCMNNKLYCILTSGEIAIIDINNNYSIQYLDLNLSSAWCYDSVYNPITDEIFFGLFLPVQSIYALDITDNTYRVIAFPGETIMEMSFFELDNNWKVFARTFVSSNLQRLWRCDQNEVFQQISLSQNKISDNSSSETKLYLCSPPSSTIESQLLYEIDASNETIEETELPCLCYSLEFNSEDNKVYFYSPGLPSNNIGLRQYKICSHNFLTGDFESYPVGIEYVQKGMSPVFHYAPDIVLNYEDNKIYFNAGYERVTVFDYVEPIYETKTYTFPHSSWIPDCGWKWLSFDILWPEEDDNIAVNFLAPISGIDELDYAQFKPHEDNSSQLTISFNPFQQHLDHPFTSPYGYKFKTITNCQFTVTGERWNDNTMSLYGDNQENWIGYFLEETQHIYDAFADHLDNMTGIRAQHWAIKNLGGWPDVPYTISPGDMVIAYFEDDEPAFYWNSGESTERYTVPESQDFTYEEEADYIPVFLELDPEDMPSEIGAYVDGECKGATVVQDESAQICAYILENQGENLEFEFSYGNRSVNKQINEYNIIDPETSKIEKGAIQIDNSRDYYYVSFKDNQNDTPELAEVEITNFPNPFNPETTLFFSLPTEQEIELTVYNLKGQKVKQLAKGQFPSGQNSIVWNGKDEKGKLVGSGLYFYKLKTAEKVISNKMLLLK